MSLELVFHGGNCCAIKTIKGFNLFNMNEEESARKSKNPLNTDANGGVVSSGTSCFYQSAPEETQEKRLERYVNFLKKWRPQGAVEVTLARSRYNNWDQNKVWEKKLFSLGFKVTVPEFLNSNSNNYVTIYHLVYDATAEKAASTLSNPFGRSE